tara:strand:+ start:39006 stop:39536 length:531 start_codon:yes stop_codon:yes gene_type:complete
MKENASKYGNFAAMIGTSTAVMLALMYLNSYSVEHVFWSETRFYMALYMGAAMAIVMLSFMLQMYSNTARNISIYVGSTLLFALALYLVRSQDTIQDQSWMKAMIPHHSIAILTSERAEIDDLRVRELADGIIKAQRREIKEMQWLIDDIQKNGPASTVEAAEARPVPPFKGKLQP